MAPMQKTAPDPECKSLVRSRFPTVREGGLEPPCPHGHTDLNRARLPISPPAPIMRDYHRRQAGFGHGCLRAGEARQVGTFQDRAEKSLKKLSTILQISFECVFECERMDHVHVDRVTHLAGGNRHHAAERLDTVRRPFRRGITRGAGRRGTPPPPAWTRPLPSPQARSCSAFPARVGIRRTRPALRLPHTGRTPSEDDRREQPRGVEARSRRCDDPRGRGCAGGRAPIPRWTVMHTAQTNWVRHGLLR